MYVIATNNISNISMSNQDSNYPASNTQNKHIKLVAKATTYRATFSFNVSKFNTISIFNTNATYIKYRNVTDGTSKEFNLLVSGEHISISERLIDGNISRNMLIFDSELNGSFSNNYLLNKSIEIELITTSDILFVGLIYGGVMARFGISTIESKDEFIDNSIEYTSSNGSPLIYPKIYRMDKNIKIFATRIEYNSLIQLLQQKRAIRDIFMVFSLVTSDSQMLLFNNLKFGYIKEISINQDFPYYVDFNAKLIEGF